MMSCCSAMVDSKCAKTFSRVRGLEGNGLCMAVFNEVLFVMYTCRRRFFPERKAVSEWKRFSTRHKSTTFYDTWPFLNDFCFA